MPVFSSLARGQKQRVTLETRGTIFLLDGLIYSILIQFFCWFAFFPHLLQMVRANSGSWSVVQKSQHIKYLQFIVFFFSFLICSSVLEYDAEGFMKLSLLFKVQGFFCIVHSKCSFWYKFEVKTKQHILHFVSRK